jgi:hypothetical protein
MQPRLCSVLRRLGVFLVGAAAPAWLGGCGGGAATGGSTDAGLSSDAGLSGGDAGPPLSEGGASGSDGGAHGADAALGASEAGGSADALAGGLDAGGGGDATPPPPLFCADAGCPDNWPFQQPCSGSTFCTYGGGYCECLSGTWQCTGSGGDPCPTGAAPTPGTPCGPAALKCQYGDHACWCGPDARWACC